MLHTSLEDPGISGVASNSSYLEDHPRTCKWLISMVSFRPLSRVGSLPNGRFMADKWGLLTTY